MWKNTKKLQKYKTNTKQLFRKFFEDPNFSTGTKDYETILYLVVSLTRIFYYYGKGFFFNFEKYFSFCWSTFVGPHLYIRKTISIGFQRKRKFF